MSNFWGNIDDTPEVNKTMDTINIIIRELEQKTDGKIKASFSKIQYSKSEYGKISLYLNEIFEKKVFLKPPSQREPKTIALPNVETKGKKDLNDYYSLDAYRFEIYTETYKFEIFQLFNSIAFPVRMILDEGIASELKLKNAAIEITSNWHMERFLRDVLGTNTVRNVVHRLLVLGEIESVAAIEQFLSARPDGATAAEIAQGIKCNESLTLEKLKSMLEQQKVEEVKKSDGINTVYLWKHNIGKKI